MYCTRKPKLFFLNFRKRNREQIGTCEDVVKDVVKDVVPVSGNDDNLDREIFGVFRRRRGEQSYTQLPLLAAKRVVNHRSGATGRGEIEKRRASREPIYEE